MSFLWGVKQKNKVRPIDDDYKASLVNYAVTQNEGVTIHTIDHIASMLAFWMRSGSLSPDDGLVAKCWDLSDAYKQVPLSDEAFTWQSMARVLPFGSIASATAFLRVSLALWKVGSTLLHLMWSVYFDDFWSRSSESKHVDFCADALFSLLGWRISKHKLLEFNAVCKVLGVQLDLQQSGDRLCFITNTDERVEELTKELDEALHTKRNSEADFNLPAHKFSEESSGGCLKFCQIMSLKAGRHCLSTLKHALLTFASC